MSVSIEVGARAEIYAVVRSLAQMAVVGAALVPIVDPDTPLWGGGAHGPNTPQTK